ncbi:MAG TPA: sortase [Acidimicrobiales bacterium]|nr:sortase [Acidimicrobiales bacterium]
MVTEIDLPTGPADAVDDPAAGEPEPAVPDATRTGPPAPKPVAVVLAVILLLGVTAVFFGVFAFGLSGLQEQRSQHQLYAAFRGLLAPASPVAPSIGGDIPEGAPVAMVTAPDAGLDDVMVVEGTSSGDLLAGPGHLADTPLPGQAGESVLIGKSTTAGAPFGRIGHLHRGDRVTVRTGQGRFRFTVLGHLPPGARLPKITTDSGLLTLVSAASSGGLGVLAPDRLVYVVAKLDGKVAPTPPHQPTSVPTSQVQGHIDGGAWPFVLVWFVGLLAASAACWWLWTRWGMLRTWLVGAPVLLALLWGFSNEAMRFLPNAY